METDERRPIGYEAVHDHPYTGPVSFPRAVLEGERGPVPVPIGDSPDVVKWRRILSREPEEYGAWLWLGRSLTAQFRFNEAIVIYSRAIERFPDRYDAFKLRAGCYTDTLRFDQAAADLIVAMRLGAPRDAALYSLGTAQYLRGDYERSAGSFEQLLDLLEPDSPMRTAAADWLYLSALRCGKSEAQREALLQIPRLSEPYAAYRLRCAVYSGRIGFDEGVSLALALPREIQIVTSLYGLSVYCGYVLGDRARAARLREEILARRSYWPALGYLAALTDSEAEDAADGRDTI